jgi:hypothetical protein
MMHHLTLTPADIVCREETTPELTRIQTLRAHLEEYRQVLSRTQELGLQLQLADNASARLEDLARVSEGAAQHETACRLGVKHPEPSWEYLWEQHDSFIESMNRALVQVKEQLQAVEVVVGSKELKCQSPRRRLGLCPMVSGAVCFFLYNPGGKEMVVSISTPAREGLIMKGKQVRLFGRTMLPVLVEVAAGEKVRGRVEMEVEADSRRLRVPVEISSIPWARLVGTVVDSRTKKKVACRVQVRGEGGRYYHPVNCQELTVSRSWGETFCNRYIGERFFYCDGSFEVAVPAEKLKVKILCGFEYEVLEETVEPKAKATLSRTFGLERWINMPALGWYSGQTHVHFRQFPATAGWHLLPEAEGLNVVHVLTYKHFGVVHSDDYPVGKIGQFSRKDYLVYMGEEYRHEPYGHLCLVNLKQMVEPISTGKLGGSGCPDYPPNAHACDEAHAQGGLTIYAHFGGSLTFPGGTEMPVDAALGKLDCAEIMGAGGHYQPWYHILNCGIRMAAAAGPDWWIEDCPRSYVYVGKRLSYEKWIAGLRQGRNFVTNGPILFFTADKRLPGAVIRLGAKGGAIQVAARAQHGAAPTAGALKKLEIVKNGEVVEEVESKEGCRELSLARTVRFSESGWLAARCSGEGSAHSSPVYVMVGEKPSRWAKDAALCLEVVNKIIAWVKDHGKFEAARHRREVVRLFERGRAFFEGIVRTGRRD